MAKLKVKFLVKTEAGMSLAEAMVVISIFLILLGGITTSLNISTQYWNSNKVRVELQQELRLAMTWISSDLRQTSPFSIFDVPADGAVYTWITFQIPTDVTNSTADWSANIRYILLTGVDSTRLQRIEGIDAKIIANNIQTLEFTRQEDDADTLKDESDVLEVSLSAQKDTIHGRTITNDLNFLVQLRN